MLAEARGKGELSEEEEAGRGRQNREARSLQEQRLVPWPSRTQPGPGYSAVPTPWSGQLAMVSCLLVQCDWKNKSKGGNEPEGGDIGEGFKTWRRAGLLAPVPARACLTAGWLLQGEVFLKAWLSISLCHSSALTRDMLGLY